MLMVNGRFDPAVPSILDHASWTLSNIIDIPDPEAGGARTPVCPATYTLLYPVPPWGDRNID